MTAESGTTNAAGAPVRHMWAAGTPDLSKTAAGFPTLNAETFDIFVPSREDGGYNHHSQLIRHDGRFFAMWSNHPHGEDGPGQRVLWSWSDVGEVWAPWQELFPSVGEVKLSELNGLVLTAFKWVCEGNRLFAVAGLHANAGFQDMHGTKYSEKRVPGCRMRRRIGYSLLAREVSKDTLGPVFALAENRPDEPAYELPLAAEVGMTEAAERVTTSLADPLKAASWDFEGVWSFPRGIDGTGLCEPTAYRAGDGKYVLLQRDHAMSHRMYASFSDDNGLTWSKGEPTDIPDSPSLSTTVNLDDGRVLLIGNQVADRFDNPDDPAHYVRDPLTIAVSRDGYLYEKAYALRWDVPGTRIENVLGRGRGAQYPCALVHDEILYVIHTASKEDVAISRVALSEIR